MTDEQIVEAAKSAEQKTEFVELVHSKVSQGVNSAYGIGFLEGAEWARKQMMGEAVEKTVFQVTRKRTPVIMLTLDANEYKDGDKVRVIILKKED